MSKAEIIVHIAEEGGSLMLFGLVGPDLYYKRLTGELGDSTALARAH